MKLLTQYVKKMYNDINNNRAGDDMNDVKDSGALINQIRDVTRDHIDWIKSQLLKPNNFIVAKGREVWVDVPNSNLKNIVTIPSKGDPNYRKAWVRVYNLAVDYLEGSLGYACMKGDLDYRMIRWPDFDPENANYARALEIVLDKYKLFLEMKRKEEIEKPKIVVNKSSVMLSPVDSKVIDDSYIEEVHEEPVEEVFNEENSSEMYEENEVQDLEQIDSEFVAQKILDGDKLTQKDFRDLRDQNAKLVILPCLNVDNIKDEKVFLENMHVCSEEGMKSGAMIYGSATDEREAVYELKKIFKLLDQCGSSFIRYVIYEVNDNFVKKNKDSEMKLLSFINAYSMIAEGLAKEKYVPMIAMNVTSKKILSDIYNRYNLENKYETVYVTLVRELDELDKGDSTILMDPQYDYDLLTVRDTRFRYGEMLQQLVDFEPKSTTLANVA